MIDALSFAKRMCTSLFQDSRRLTCQVERLDELAFVGYSVDLGRAVSAAGRISMEPTGLRK